MKLTRILTIYVMILALVTSGCALKTPAPAVPVAAQPPCRVDAGMPIPLLATSVAGSVTLEWSASIGEITPSQGPTVTYIAPKNYSGDVVIVLTTSSGNKSTSANLICTVLPSPTDTPTDTPIPATDTPTPAPTASLTSTPPPTLTEIFPMNNSGVDFNFLGNGGILMAKFLATSACIHSGVYGLQLIYEMKGQGFGGWGIHWDQSPSKKFDASGFNAITFWVRGTSGSEIFELAMKDTSNKEVKVKSEDLVVINDQWTKITAPFSKFAGVNFASLNNFTISFNEKHGSGSICLDDFAFE